MDRTELANALGLPELPAYLKKLDRNLQGLVTGTPSGLKGPLARAVRGGGKRLRPAILIAAAAGTGRPINDQVIAAAAAIELVHLASIVHDDVLDNAAVRRGRPALSNQESPAIAVLAGDFLLAKACAQATAVSRPAGIMLAGTIAVMADGAAQEINGSDIKPLSKDYLEISKKKTAALFSASCRLGGMLSGLTKREIESLGRYGEAFGTAFQIIDDLIDRDIPERLAPQALSKIQQYNARAAAALKELKPGPVTAGLAELPNFYLAWVIENQNAIV